VTASPLRQTRKKNVVTLSTSSASRDAQEGAVTKTGDRRMGTVSFVGAGPGDPDLLTVKALELIRRADVVVTEGAAHADLVRSVRGHDPDSVTLVEGGVADDGSVLTHAARGRVVVKQARSGVGVVRLLVGDPFLHGTAPEEALACHKAGIPFEIVPGVSAAAAVPAYAGIPLTTRTQRDVAIVRVGDGRVDWESYRSHPTLVVLSAGDRVGEVAGAVIAAGRDPQTPAALTSAGTTTGQATVVAPLDRIATEAKAAHLEEPAVLVIGEVVSMRESLSWFETKPLFGWRVLVPRTKEQSAGLVSRLRTHGAVPEEVPTISVEPPRNPQQMDKAVRGLVEGRYEWIAFTSVNAVKAVRERFDEYGLDARAFSGLKIAAVGGRRPPRPSRPGVSAPTWCRPASSPRAGCSRTGRRSTSCSTRSTGCSSRARTSPPRPWSPA